MGDEQQQRGFRTSRNRLSYKRLSAIAAVALLAAPVYAADNDTLIDRWYTALQNSDAEAIGELLSPNAVIKLNDQGISQSKAEFIESLGEWKSAIAGGSVRHRSDGEVDGAFAYKVCYKFPSNELLTREVFTFVDDRIASSDQTTISESCTGF